MIGQGTTRLLMNAVITFPHLNKFNSLDELEADIEDYIHYYNHSRIRLKLSGLSPVEYRTQARRAYKASNISGSDQNTRTPSPLKLEFGR